MRKIIAFSGSCYSGKSTAMNNLKKALSSEADVIMHGELMRDRMDELTGFKYASIDDLRSNSSDYLKVQKVIIPEKINAELAIHSSIDISNSNALINDSSFHPRDMYVLLDRSVADSLFYLVFYTNVSSLSKKELSDFNNLYIYVHTYAQILFERVYDKVFLFEPLLDSNKNKDTFRPQRLDLLKLTEYNLIRQFTKFYCPKEKLVLINPNDYDVDSLADVLHEYI